MRDRPAHTNKFVPFELGTYNDGAFTVLAVKAGTNVSSTIYQCRWECCGDVHVKTHRDITRRVNSNRKKCQICSAKDPDRRKKSVISLKKVNAEKRRVLLIPGAYGVIPPTWPVPKSIKNMNEKTR